MGRIFKYFFRILRPLLQNPSKFNLYLYFFQVRIIPMCRREKFYAYTIFVEVRPESHLSVYGLRSLPRKQFVDISALPMTN